MSQKSAPPIISSEGNRSTLFHVIGDSILGTCSFVGEVVLLTSRSLGLLLRGGLDSRDLLKQMATLGADSVWIVAAITAATGAVFSLYTTNLAQQIGFTQFVGGTIGYGFLNELGPVLGGVAFASRCGAAIAAEIGSMVVTEQVDALRAMAVSPIRYLVLPRIIAGILMLPLLIVLGDAAGLLGSAAFANSQGITLTVFWESLRKYTYPIDLFNGLIKALFFGYLVTIIACQQGLRTKGGATGVGRATTRSVVLCVVMIFIADFFLAQLLTSERVRD